MKRFCTEKEWRKARLNYLTSTDIPLLFEYTKYGRTIFSLFQEKMGTIEEEPSGERIEWGIALEDAIAKKVCKDSNWELLDTPEWGLCIDEERGLASSIDRLAKDAEGEFVLEVKNVDGLVFAAEWERDEGGNHEAPLHIELQLQAQLMMTKKKRVKCAALIGGNKLVLLERTLNEELAEIIYEKAEKFWDKVARKEAPPPSDDGTDYSNIKKVYDFVTGEVSKSSEESEDVAHKLREAQIKEKEANEKVKGLKTKLITELAGKKKLLGGEWTFSASEVPERDITYTRKGYVTHRITYRGSLT